MNKKEKEQYIVQFHQRFESTSTAFLLNYRGLNVASLTNLREELKGVGSELKVVRNTLILRASEGTPFEVLKSDLSGPIAIAFGDGNATAVAKVILEFAVENPHLLIISGLLGNQRLSSEQVNILSKTPPREQLLSKTILIIKSPINNFSFLLSNLLRNLITTLEQIKQSKKSSELLINSDF